jgi:1,4-dihydroxy-2-naphthoate octaprenyltransferase
VTGARLHTLPAALAPVAAGAGLARAEGAFSLPATLAALAAAALIQVGTNFANDYFDHAHGADTDDRKGGFVRVTQAGLVPPWRVRRWMAGAFAAACLPGAYLVWVGGGPILAVGLASIAAGVAYTGGPWPLGYHGLGELFVFVFFGLVAVSGTHYVNALRFEPGTLLAGAGVGGLTAAILVVNNLRDRETDARAGKRTLAVRLGVRGTRAEYAGLLLVAAAAPAAGVAALGWSPWTLSASAAVAAAVPAARTVISERRPEALDGALVGTARAVALYGVLLGVGAVL